MSWSDRLAAAAVVAVAMLSGAPPAVAQALAWPQEPPPRPLPSRQVAFPPYEVRTLPNGMQVMAVLHHEQPVVTMRLVVKAGAAQDPDKQAGVAYLAARLLDQGTTTRNAGEIADQIDSIGGVLGVSAGTDLTSAFAVVMKDSFEVGMRLLSDIVRNPAFASEEIERQKQQTISSLQVSAEDPNYVASMLFERLVYGFHPYGMPGSGTPDTLAAITSDDLRAFHRQYFVPNNVILAVVGDVTSEEAFSMAGQVFGGWDRGEVPSTAPIDPPEPTRRIVIVDRPESVQTEIRVGQLAIPRKHPDFLAWDLAVKVLGGEGANRLHQVLRSQRALTYGASADTQAMKQAGNYVAETDTRTETTGEALRLMVEEFSRLPRQRVFERELADAQAYLAGSFPLTIETPNQIATQILQNFFFELPVEEIATFRERVLAVTPDDIQRVARAYIRPDRLSVVLVGNAQAFIPQLQALGFTDFEVIPLHELDLSSATLRREMTGLVLPQPSASFDPAIVSGRAAYTATQVNPTAGQAPAAQGQAAGAAASSEAMALLRRVVDAKGGLAALKGVRSMVVDAETTLMLQRGPVPSTTTTYVVYPEKFRVDATVAGAEIVQVYNAGTAWVRDPAGVHDAPPAMRNDFAANVRRDMIPLLIGAVEGRFTVRALPDATGADGPLKVLEISGSELPAVRLSIDAGMRIVRQAYTAQGPDGQTIANEESFSDYRTVDGISIPFQAQLLQGGQPVVTRTISSVAVNVPVAETLFARPR